MKQVRISRRQFIISLPIASVAAGILISGNDKAAALAIEDTSTGKYFESSLKCLTRIDRVYRFDHVN